MKYLDRRAIIWQLNSSMISFVKGKMGNGSGGTSPVFLQLFNMKRWFLIIAAMTFALIGCASPQVCNHGTNIKKVIYVEAFADQEYRNHQFLFLSTQSDGWKQDIEDLIRQASCEFERQFGIKLAIRSIQPWNSKGNAKTLRELLYQFRGDFVKGKVGTNDGETLILVFSGRIFEETPLLGPYLHPLGFGVSSLKIAIVNNKARKHVLVHEIGHVFGATHPQKGYYTHSVMDPVHTLPETCEFDEENKKIIRENVFQ